MLVVAGAVAFDAILQRLAEDPLERRFDLHHVDLAAGDDQADEFLVVGTKPVHRLVQLVSEELGLVVEAAEDVNHAGLVRSFEASLEEFQKGFSGRDLVLAEDRAQLVIAALAQKRFQQPAVGEHVAVFDQVVRVFLRGIDVDLRRFVLRGVAQRDHQILERVGIVIAKLKNNLKSATGVEP